MADRYVISFGSDGAVTDKLVSVVDILKREGVSNIAEVVNVIRKKGRAKTYISLTQCISVVDVEFNPSDS